MDAGLKHSKNPNPRENANPCSALTFCWTIPTFIKGFKRDLDVVDLPETLREHKSSRLGNRLAAAWEREERRAARRKCTPSLHRAIYRVFGLEFLFYGIVLAISEIGVRMIQPILLGQLIQYYSPNNVDISKEDAYLYAVGVILCSLICVFVTHPYMMGMLHLGMKVRVACCSLIYRKSLKLSKTALGHTTVGQVVNLLSNDVNRFDVAVIFAHQLWVGPLETIIITYLMYLQVGYAAIVGVVFMLGFVPLQVWLGKLSSIFRLKTALRTDERVRLMNEIISGIQVIKMYTWEMPFTLLVDLARRKEITEIRKMSYLRGILLSFIMFTTRISIFVSVVMYVLSGYSITAEQVFVVTSFYSVLRQSMTVFFPQGISQIAEANVSINRLNKFMLYDETELANHIKMLDHEAKSKERAAKQKAKKSKKNKANGAAIPVDIDNNLSGGGDPAFKDDQQDVEPTKGIMLEHATAKWTEASMDNTLTDLSMIVKPGQLTAVIGPVGSGKSSLLHMILQELPLTHGKLAVNGVVSYASQEPWLFAGTVRQNILFGQPMNRDRYKEVIKKCALERDMTILPHGDKTIVGERGVSLSGGQRARINLARAVYKEADIYLLDDPLSAVDTHVGKQLYENCITGYLKRKTCILITHQLQYLKEVDQIVMLDDGRIAAKGNYTELSKSGLNFANLMKEDALVEEEEELGEESSTNPLAALRYASDASIVSSIDDKTVEAQPSVDEQKTVGKVGGFVYKEYFKAGGNCCAIFSIFMLFIVTQLAASAGDYFITYWVNLEESRNRVKSQEQNRTFSRAVEEKVQDASLDAADGAASFWDFSTDVCIYIYTVITVATVIVTLMRSFAFFYSCMQSSVNLHDRMFRSITRATMRFFNTNPSGRILNRFSKDMGAIDELLPGAMIDCLQIGLSLIGIIIVVGIVNPWLLLPTLAIGIVFYLLRIFYLATSRSVKRLEGITRSPVFGHLNASLQGLTTIRAFGAERILEHEFDNHQDLHSAAWYIFIGSSRAFGFWLDLICIIYIAVVTLSFLVFSDEKFGGNVGLAITQSIGLTGMFQWGMRQSTELENQMTSVERVLEYSSIEHEAALETPENLKPPKSWPENGKIQFRQLFLRYFAHDPPVLKNLNFVVTPKEKVGIVGRTGAGKSSLINALFQLSDTTGAVLIDGIDTKTLGLHELRSKIAIIPQEPVLFSGTMRTNLDPFNEYDDFVLWKALEAVELKEVVEDLAAGLNSKMSEGGSNFSVGQRQLVCLARAIIRKNKILVLDEATANVDPQTDALIQHTIRRKFEECTVLTIAHRLHTVMDSDKVMVMDAGAMVEFDHPHVLLLNKHGFLYSMVQQTGKAMADVLMRVASESYNKKSSRTNVEQL